MYSSIISQLSLDFDILFDRVEEFCLNYFDKAMSLLLNQKSWYQQ
jgi:hypothetical protein